MVTWITTKKESYVVTCPPGPLGLTIKQFFDEWIVVDSIHDMYSDHPLSKIGVTDIITTIDGKAIESEDDIPITCTKDTEIGVGECAMGMNAAAQSKGVLLAMKYVGCTMFRMMDYSHVAERYGEEFMEELNPPQRKRGNQLFGEALAGLASAKTNKKTSGRGGKKAVSKKTVAKKAATKKAVTKKTVAKKAATKEVVEKKVVAKNGSRKQPARKKKTNLK